MSRRARRRAGFTLIEVMVSLGVMMVGAMAVIGLQAHAIRGNAHARRVTIATQIAQRWIERFKQDAATWNAIDATAATFANTRYLGVNLAGMTANPDAFLTLPVDFQNTGISNAFDARGQEVDPDGPKAFCISYRPSWIWTGHLMRIEVRVFWPRKITRPDGTRPNLIQDSVFDGCADDDAALNPGGDQYDWYHTVYLTTAIRVNEVVR